MSFQEVSTAKKYIKYSECNKGDELVVGWYIGATEGKFGTQYNFMTETGVHTVLNASGQLDYIIKNHIQQEDFVKIIFDGQVKLEKGAMAGKMANQFKFYKDPSRAGKRASYVEVAAPEAAPEEDVVI
jgi:hypothetical protein